jgi:protein-S-isoprenylcysteine O-methyltransferase
MLATLAIIGFVLIEFLLRKGASAKSLRTGATDRGSTVAIISAYALVAVALSIRLPGPHVPPVWRWLAGICAIVGVFLRVLAFRTLGSSYSRTLRVESNQSLVTHGLYRWVRHPGYAAAIVIWSGAAAASGSLAALVVVFVVLVAV